MTTSTQGSGTREPATVRVAMWCSRHRWPVVALWFIGTIGLFLVSLPGGGIKAEDPNGNPNQAQTESAKAYAAFQSGGTNEPSEDVSSSSPIRRSRSPIPPSRHTSRRTSQRSRR